MAEYLSSAVNEPAIESRNPNPRPRSDVLGVKIDTVSTEDLLTRIEDLVADRRPRQITYVNAHCILNYLKDPGYAQIVDKSEIVYADGQGVVWASRFSETRLPERVNAGDFSPEFARFCVRNRYRVYLLGGRPEVLESLVRGLSEWLPDLDIVGYHHGYFGDEGESAVVEDIRSLNVDILLVGMGVPRQEEFIDRNIDNLGAAICWGVGALFEYFSGHRKRCPFWMRTFGVEWLFRLCLEPRRLWRRYLLGNPLFVLRLLLHIVRSDPASKTR